MKFIDNLLLIILIFYSVTSFDLYGESDENKIDERITKIYKDEILSPEVYYEKALKGELARPDENKKAFLSSMELISKKETGASQGGIYKDSNNDIWIVKKGQNPVDEYLGSKVMNLLIGPWSPEVMLLVDAPDYTASKLLPGFLMKRDVDSDPNHKLIIGESNLEVAMNLIGLGDRHDRNMGYIKNSDRLEAARVDFDHSFKFEDQRNIMKNITDSKTLSAIETIYTVPDEMILYVLGDAYNSLWAAGISLDYEKYKDLGSTLIARKHGLRPLNN